MIDSRDGWRDQDPLVLVIGSASIDTKGHVHHAITPGTSMPGEIRSSVGGVARNVAENLARLGIRTLLLSAVGQDGSGRRLLTQAEASGIDVSQVIQSPEHHTAAYVTILAKTGMPFVAVDDMTAMEDITPSYIYSKRRWFRDASMIVLDANLQVRTLDTIFVLAERYQVPICADPTSASLAPRLIPYFDRLFMVTPNVLEAEALGGGERGTHREAAIRSARKLVSLGVQVALITRAERGVCYATTESSGHVPALACDILDLTGAGDALTAGVVFGLLNDFPIDEAVRLGVSAAALSLQSQDSVSPELSLERLYDQLVI